MFDIVDHVIDSEALRRDILDDAAGGLVIFEGLVRDHNEGRAVSALEYEIFSAMACKEAARIFAEARQLFDVIHLRGAHRAGFLNVGEMAVWVGVSARHREAAFRACQYLIDEIKFRLPVWKKEHYVAGAAEWVDCQGCYHHHDHPDVRATEYYSRQLNLPDFGVDEQARLQAAKVLVVGAGGLGCPALSALAGAGVGQITVCDGDRLDVSNLHRQTIYSHEDIGEFKAVLAARRLADLNPLIKVTARPSWLDVESARKLVADHDLVLDCTDNFRTKFLLHDCCALARRVLVQASIYQYEGQLQVFDFRGTSDAGCMRCAWPEIPDEGCVGSCAEAGVLGAVPAVLGGLQAMETIKILTGRPSPATAATVLVDLLSLETSTIRRPRTPDCPLCGMSPRITSIEPRGYAPPEAWELVLADFRARFPAGRIIDTREPAARGTLTPEQQTWENISAARADLLLALPNDQDTLIVCMRGISSRQIVKMLRAGGKDRMYSLWQGVNGLRG